MADTGGGRGRGRGGSQSRRGGGGGRGPRDGAPAGNGEPPNPDAGLNPPPFGDPEEEVKVEKECYYVMPEGSVDMSNLTIVVKNEGHTVGNLLRTVIASYPEVKFVGHTIPHPSENELHVRIQVESGHDAQELFVRGLKEIMEICDHTEEVFNEAVETYKNDPARKDEGVFVAPAPPAPKT